MDFANKDLWGLEDSHLVFFRKVTAYLKKRGFKQLGSGRHRCTFLFPSGKYVLKVPINDEGEEANVSEAKAYSQNLLPYPLAKCRLFQLFNKSCIVMEYVERLWKNLPDWTVFIDCQQVGRSRARGLVAFDYSLDFHTGSPILFGY